jgi:hypothetical protein
MSKNNLQVSQITQINSSKICVICEICGSIFIPRKIYSFISRSSQLSWITSRMTL